jgi:hypothetical protein
MASETDHCLCETQGHTGCEPGTCWAESLGEACGHWKREAEEARAARDQWREECDFWRRSAIHWREIALRHQVDPPEESRR